MKEIAGGKLTVGEAMKELKEFPFRDLGFARIDTHRDLRKGFPEVVFCEGKTLKQVQDIFSSVSEGALVMGTRAGHDVFEAVMEVRPDAEYNETARIILAGEKRRKSGKPIAVLSAGTADIPVAEEAAFTAEAMGNRVKRVFDIGVAGIHRALASRKDFADANVVIVAAGMEGALASIVGGMVERPVIAVPTSVGYGAGFGGIAPLLTMLNSCAPGVATVNIDNGFGAGYMAALINKVR